MGLDPLTDDPTVITGSANFSESSILHNDENMLIIRGNTRVADIFLTEFMRLFRLSRSRQQLMEMREEQREAASSLVPTDAWAEEYYKQGSQEWCERLLFR